MRVSIYLVFVMGESKRKGVVHYLINTFFFNFFFQNYKNDYFQLF